jgi:hypothetical protein
MKKIILICLSLVLALGGFGVAYSLWFDTVVVSGDVQTGSLNLAFDPFEPAKVDEYHIVYEPYEHLEPGEFLGKNVGVTTATYLDSSFETDPATGLIGFSTIVLDVNNAYPCYYVATTFVFKNIGSIPLDITGWEVEGYMKETPENGGEIICPLLWGDEYLGIGDWWWYPVHADINENGVIDPDEPEIINFRITNGFPYQMEWEAEKHEIDLHFKQPLIQEKVYSFKVTFHAEQWEEFAE